MYKFKNLHLNNQKHLTLHYTLVYKLSKLDINL